MGTWHIVIAKQYVHEVETGLVWPILQHVNVTRLLHTLHVRAVRSFY